MKQKLQHLQLCYNNLQHSDKTELVLTLASALVLYGEVFLDHLSAVVVALKIQNWTFGKTGTEPFSLTQIL
jgi:hypothetical protein